MQGSYKVCKLQSMSSPSCPAFLTPNFIFALSPAQRSFHPALTVSSLTSEKRRRLTCKLDSVFSFLSSLNLSKCIYELSPDYVALENGSKLSPKNEGGTVLRVPSASNRIRFLQQTDILLWSLRFWPPLRLQCHS